MRKFQILFSLFFVFALSANAQFYQTPDWIRDIPLHGEITAVGISDPRLSVDSVAQIQAEMRAKAMIAMLREVEVLYTSEHFQVETEEHRTYKLQEIVEKLGKYSSRLPYHPDDFHIVESFKNENKEQFVLMAWDDRAEAKNSVLNVYCEFYSKEYEVSNTRAYAAAEVAEIHITDSTPEGVKSYTCMLEFDGRDVSMSTTTNGFKYDPPGYVYRYRKTSDLENINQFDVSSSLEKGVWQALIRGFLHASSEDAKNYDSKIKNLDDMYRQAEESNESYEDATMQQELSRQVVKTDMTFFIHGMEIDQNVLFLNISTPQLGEDSPNIYIPPPPPDSIPEVPCKRTFWDWLFGRNKCN